jgi:threonine dehydrogenase-like Zn-dependent dehydrogenase
MGEVVETGRAVQNLKKGDRVVVPFTIACGNCWFCTKGLTSLCDNTNPNAWVAEKMMGYSGSALFGYTHIFGGYAGGQAEYVRVPHADFGCLEIPEGMPDEKVIFLTDIFPTGYMAAENCNIQPGDVVAVWGCGPVGQFAIRSAQMLGAETVIAIDDVPERLHMAAAGGATVIDMHDEYIYERLWELTGGRGPDACIDAVGMESHGMTLDAAYDRVAQKLMIENDRGHALRQAINCCRKGGTVSIPGVYSGLVDKLPMGVAMNKGLTMKMGQTHMHRYLRPLLERVQKGEIDPSFVITHQVPLTEAPRMYSIFQKKQDGCIKVVLKP